MKWTVIKESDPRKGQCGRSTCKYEAPVATVPEKEAKWTVKEVSVTPPIVEEEQQTATVA